MVPEKFDKLWLVQLATGIRHNVTSLVRNCKLMMNDFCTHVNVDILPLRSYDLLIGMDWLDEHKVVLNSFDKRFTCIDDNGDNIKVKGIPRKVTIREKIHVTMKRPVIKGCKVFFVYIMNDNENDNKIKLEYILVLKEFEDIFLEEVPVLHLKRC